MASIVRQTIFTVHEIVKFRDKTCLITKIDNTLGFNQYEVVDIDTGHSMKLMAIS